MGSITLISEPTLLSNIEGLVTEGKEVNLMGWMVPEKTLLILGFILVFVWLIALVLNLFLKTDLGLGIRAAGSNAQMIRALGANDKTYMILTIAISNGLIALSGSLLAQYQGFADVQMGIGMVVWGLASVIIGEALLNSKNISVLLAGAIFGSVLFRLLVAIALQWGMNPNDLKLVTAIFVFIALVLPGFMSRLDARRKIKKIDHAEG